MATSRNIKTWRDPYDSGFSTTRLKNITINSGVTIFVGCNGAGKTTLLNNIADVLRKDKIPYLKFNNLTDGGTKSISEMIHLNNAIAAANMWTSSEGENITNNLCMILAKTKSFLETGEYDDRKNRFAKLFHSEDPEPITSNERWLLFDAIDSGYSIDNVLDLKYAFEQILENAKEMNLDVYIIVTANAYEMTHGENCFDVMNGKYITFKNYDEYKKFIIKSREKKEKRYGK